MTARRIHDERGVVVAARVSSETAIEILQRALAAGRSRNAIVRETLEREFSPSHASMMMTRPMDVIPTASGAVRPDIDRLATRS